MFKIRRVARWLAPAWILLVLAAAGACREDQSWPPEVAALVDDRPITLEEVNRVLTWGLHGQLGSEKEENHEVVAALRLGILEKLIEERLLLDEAGRRGIGARQEEIDRAASLLSSAWFGRTPPPEQASALREALRNQIISHKITGIIIAEERRLSARSWKEFWGNWPKNRPARYQVRALLLPPEAVNPGSSARNRGDLDQQAEKYSLDGWPVLLSDPLWLQADSLEKTLLAALETAWVRRRPTEPQSQTDGWAVYQVEAVDRRWGATEEFEAARLAYERRVGEEAFRLWMEARRASADIKINPNLANAPE